MSQRPYGHVIDADPDPLLIVLITRGLAEMTRIGTAYGASPLTFLSLAGVGDLFLTCSSPTSRNYTVGHRLGKGEKLEHIIETLGSVAEGVSTTKGLKEIIDDLDLGVSAPIAEAVRALGLSLVESWILEANTPCDYWCLGV